MTRKARSANEIIPGAGTYLDKHVINLFIRAEITDAQAQAEIARQKGFFQRAALLLPDFLRYFAPESEWGVLALLSNISDTHLDFDNIASEKRQDRNRREILLSFTAAMAALEEAIKALQAAHYTAGYDFNEVRSARDNDTSKPKPHEDALKALISDMELCINSIEVTHYRARTEDAYVFVPHNQSRTHVVENAYGMCRRWGGPPFVTTPGSDFSTVCSLLLELASGTAEESLAGAISRFARSREKADKDAYDLEHADEGTPEHEQRMFNGDNFYAQKRAIKGAIETFQHYQSLLGHADLSEGAKSAIKLLMRQTILQAEAASEEYGPHLIFADQRSAADFAEQRRQDEEWKVRMRELNLELGQLRRGQKPST